MKEAIILAGGLGTRLRSAVPDLPKCMAPVKGRPFLSFLIDYFQAQGIAIHTELIPAAVTLGMARLIPDAHGATLEGVGHVASLQAPRQLAELVRGFIL